MKVILESPKFVGGSITLWNAENGDIECIAPIDYIVMKIVAQNITVLNPLYFAEQEITDVWVEEYRAKAVECLAKIKRQYNLVSE